MKNFFASYRNPVSVALLIIVLGGMFAYSKMQTALFPEITFPKIKLIAENGEQPVEKMMVTVTKPLENALKQVYNVRMIRSTTSRGSCEISAFLNWNSDVYQCQQLMESKVNQIRNQLPPNTTISIEKMNPSLLPVMGFTVESNEKNPIELKLIANTIIRPFFSQVDGVAAVRVIGGKTKEYWIELNPQKMSSFSVTPAILSTALSQTNFISSNGYSTDYRRLYLNITDASLHNKEEIENVVVKNDGKRVIRLKEMAAVNVREKIEYIRINANGKDAVLITVQKQPYADLLQLSKSMEEKVKALKDVLPKNVIIKPYYNQSDFVNTTIKSVNDSLWIGLLLAIIVAVIFLRSFRASATILVIIPVTLALTVLALYIWGYTFNIMTLGAIAASIGLIIDDAIVVVEQIYRTQEEHPEESPAFVVSKSVRYLLPSMIGSSLSTIVIFLPFIWMSGVAGSYFKVLTNTMIITLLSSFFVTWICLPVVYLLFSSGFKSSKPLEQKPVRSAWIAFFLRRPLIGLSFGLALILALVYIYPRLQTGFLPEMDEGTIVLDYKSPPGTSLDETDRMLKEVEKLIVKVPEVADYSRRTGTEMGFFITEPNKGDYLIQLKPGRKRSTDAVIDDIRKQIKSTQPALDVDFGQVIGDMLGDLMSSVQPVEIKIYGKDKEKLHELANEVAELVREIPGTADIKNGIIIAGPGVDIKPDLAHLAQFNIAPDEFQYQLQSQLEGNTAGSILENEQMTDIRLIYPGDKQSSRLKNSYIFLPGGKLKPVTDFATIALVPGVAEMNRENLQSMVAVTARLNNRDLGSVVKDIKEKIRTRIHKPEGYRIGFGGAFAEQENSFRELLMILISACILVFCTILFLFRSFRAALLILIISVTGTAGSYLALYLTHTPLNVGSYTGLIMIVGIIGENAIFTFQQFKYNLDSGNTEDAILYAISTRLRPKLMTAFGAIIALLPLALGIGSGAQLHQPLAIAVIGGFLAALPLLLIVFPSMLKLVYRK
ncbi:MAG: efflux RND transporter permease subunit [Bacteroidia bacterium]